VLDGGTKMSLLDFVDKIMQENLRALMFFGYAPFIYVCHQLGISFMQLPGLLISHQFVLILVQSPHFM